MKVKKEIKFFALIIPAKDVKEFFRQHPKDRDDLDRIDAHYTRFRVKSGRKPRNEYIIVNQDEPYINEVWDIVLKGEDKKINSKPQASPSARSDNSDFKAHKSSPKPCPHCNGGTEWKGVPTINYPDRVCKYCKGSGKAS